MNHDKESLKKILDGKKVLYLPEFDLDKDMVGRWRHLWPSKYLGEYGLGYDIKGCMEPIIHRTTPEERRKNPKRHAVEIKQDMNFNTTTNRAQKHMLNHFKQAIDESDFVVFGRTNNLFASDVFEYAKNKGKVVGYEVDDLTFGEQGVFNKTDKPGDKSLGEYIGEHIKGADFVTVSTPFLRDEVAKLRGSADNIYVLKNRIDVDSLKDDMPAITPEQREQIRIGWAGGKYHIDKLIGLKDTFIDLYKKHGKKLVFVIKGIHETNMSSENERKQLEELRRIFEDNGISYELHPYTKSGDWRQYYKDLSELDLDIFYAPLNNDAPHEAKSELKYLESAYLGVPLVVPAIGGHKHAIEHDNNGILIPPEEQVKGFTDSIDELILNPEKRLRIAHNARKDLIENYDVRRSSEELADIYSEQYQKKRSRGK
ncbi:MAG: glycosyltransferase family 4 protein [Candidatus Woesearchaeota archaeon]